MWPVFEIAARLQRCAGNDVLEQTGASDPEVDFSSVLEKPE